jgi:choline dehydrogenase
MSLVGGGSAGSVLAYRLSACQSNTVCLLEAGGDPNIFNGIPLLAFYNLHHQSTDWNYVTEPLADAAFGMVDQVNFNPSRQ